jgi:hypothetical protein
MIHNSISRVCVIGNDAHDNEVTRLLQKSKGSFAVMTLVAIHYQDIPHPD